MKSHWLLTFFALTSCCRIGLTSPANDAKAGYAWIYPQKQEQEDKSKYSVMWEGRPKPIPLEVKVAMAPPLDDNDRSGVTVRVRAFDAKGKPSGQINGPGGKDDTFLTGQPCTFTPPRPGVYRLTLEVLDTAGKAVAVADYGKFQGQKYYGGLKKVQSTKLTIARPVLTQLDVSYDQWKAVEGKPNLYSRSINLFWKNFDQINLTANGYLADSWKTAVYRNMKIQFRVVSAVPVKDLDKISWVVPVKDAPTFGSYLPDVATQYFLYDPTRDAPRDMRIYTVKANAKP